MSDIDRIKEKIKKIAHNRWWGDDFDVRFFLINKIKPIQNKVVLDIGGGIGIILSEMNDNNFKINLDASFEDLKICKNQINKEINNVCASMTKIPFKKEVIDCVICANILEVGKALDINKIELERDKINSYPTVEKILMEISQILKNNGKIFITTPNNAYYQTKKLTYDELNNSISKLFKNFQIFYFNTYKKISRNRKLNMANIIPKFQSKIKNKQDVLNNLLKIESNDNYSVSFYVEINSTKPNQN